MRHRPSANRMKEKPVQYADLPALKLSPVQQRYHRQGYPDDAGIARQHDIGFVARVWFLFRFAPVQDNSYAKEKDRRNKRIHSITSVYSLYDNSRPS